MENGQDLVAEARLLLVNAEALITRSLKKELGLVSSLTDIRESARLLGQYVERLEGFGAKLPAFVEKIDGIDHRISVSIEGLAAAIDLLEERERMREKRRWWQR